MPQKKPRAPRADAARNRERLLEAARAVFSEHGLSAPLEGVARRAGVSVGTLYHHFGDRSRLIDAALLPLVERAVTHARDALDREPDAWAGLTSHLTAIAEWQAHYRGFTDICLLALPEEFPIELAKREGHRVTEQLVRRAQDAGQLRDDVTLADIGLLIWGCVRATDQVRAARPSAWRRHLAIVLDGLRAPAATALTEPPLEAADVTEAMRPTSRRPPPRTDRHVPRHA
jgi:AcrR family transcriptional regulator